ncbi:ribonuclease R [Candidatus Mycoplasma haematolamae str. Purdue]|uniref:Ribonuclease R n=1 Tax=Mycoplasma haematolamae (strain Purdue) TaxID=1212765 RepID=I7BAY1_MYCHA|nr:RNB domain-containing ribonuclease [Candidatus Mycoplasma haematolamae]AFO52445.1 ribonuclease R [Candidatus Mycoplasma haematolamae str. Purdue]
MVRKNYYKRIKINRISKVGYIPRFKLTVQPNNLGGALNNDLVAFRVLNKGISKHNQTGPTNEAYVTEVVKRFKTDFVVEVIEKKDKSIFVFFDDPQLGGLLEIQGVFSKANVGEKILVRLESFPPEEIRGRLLKILGKSGTGESDFLSLVCDLSIRNQFQGELLNTEVQRLTVRREEVLKNKHLYEDLTSKQFFTIDGDKAKDFDDAICVEQIDQGYRLYVAIADVWGYLSTCPAIMEEAIHRGTSIYLLDRVIPMLPAILSEDLCSLREGVDRHTVSVSVDLDRKGRIIKNSERIFASVIHSKKRFTYNQLNDHFLEKEEMVFSTQELKESVVDAYELSRLIQKRLIDERKPSLKIVQEKNEFKTNSNEEIVGFSKESPRDEQPAQKLIETFMILANQLVAEWMTRQEIATIYRVHKVPETAKINHFIEEVQEMEEIDLLESVDQVTVQKLNSWLERFRSHEYFKIIQGNLLQVLPKAEYSISNIGHFGINSSDYLHFTSPIRRLSDLLVHKTLWMYLLDRERYPYHERVLHSNNLESLTYSCNLSELRSITAERRFVSRKIYRYLLSINKGSIYKGVVTSRSPWGYSVRIEGLYDGFVRSLDTKRLGEVVSLKKVDYSWEEFEEVK